MASQQHLKYWNEQLAPLKGRKVLDAFMETDPELDMHGEGIPCLVLDGGLRLLLLRDEEGNGAGSFWLVEQ